jgi:hypothetical protein
MEAVGSFETSVNTSNVAGRINSDQHLKQMFDTVFVCVYKMETFISFVEVNIAIWNEVC